MRLNSGDACHGLTSEASRPIKRAGEKRMPHPLGAILTWACVLTPLALLLNVIALGVHVRIGLGHWPRPMLENYRTPEFSYHTGAIICLGFLAVYGAIPLWLLLLCFRRLRQSWKVHLLQVGSCLVGWGLFLLYMKWDPNRFVEWFLD